MVAALVSAERTCPKSWLREWINDDCGCDARVVYGWLRVPGEDTWIPVVRSFDFSRSLFCGSDHEDEIRSWRSSIVPDRPLGVAGAFPIKGNSETPRG